MNIGYSNRGSTCENWGSTFSTIEVLKNFLTEKEVQHLENRGLGFGKWGSLDGGFAFWNSTNACWSCTL